MREIPSHADSPYTLAASLLDRRSLSSEKRLYLGASCILGISPVAEGRTLL
jgi:hypothetical protein